MGLRSHKSCHNGSTHHQIAEYINFPWELQRYELQISFLREGMQVDKYDLLHALTIPCLLIVSDFSYCFLVNLLNGILG